jgi:ferredoxin
MHAYYEDILSNVPLEPLWFDENAVPRYCDFAPDKIANIYADECALMRISCQGCGLCLSVAMSESRALRITSQLKLSATLAEQIESHAIHYGDPPNIQCCASGPTMNSVPRLVLEYWKRGLKAPQWERDPTLERDIVPDWWDAEDDDE